MTQAGTVLGGRTIHQKVASLAATIAMMALPIVACGDNLPRLEAVFESEHFEVRVYPGVTIHADMLDNLEEHYRVTQGLLKFPEVKVIYSLFASIADVQMACGFTTMESGACDRGNEVFTTSGLDEHELIHAYMLRVGIPARLLREGIAQGIRCGTGSALPPTVDVPPWQTALAVSPTGRPEIYDAAFFLFVYLARQFGVDRFVAYYARARDTLDPDVFRQDFESFWGGTLDAAWQQMRQPRPGAQAIAPLCPCTQVPTLPVDGSPIELSARELLPSGNVFLEPSDRVLPLPNADPGPYLFFTRGSTFLRSCAQDRVFDLRGYELDSSKLGLISIARLAPERHYVAATGIGAAFVSVTRAAFVTPTCGAATAIAFPPDASGEIQVRIAADPGSAVGSDWYWRVTIADRSQVTISAPPDDTTQLSVCPSCDQNAVTCLNIPVAAGKVTLQATSPELVFHVSNPPDAYYLGLRATLALAASGP